MFIGHFGVALAAKRWAPRTSLGTLFLAQQVADALWPIFLLAGIERARIVPGITRANHLDLISIPWSHSLVMLLVWGVLFGTIYYSVKRNKDETAKRGAIVVGLLVMSHWFLDALVHRPDMPLSPGSELKVGLGIWNSLPATIVVEGGLFLVGIYIYMRQTEARNWRGTVPLFVLLLILAAGFFGSLFGPPPPSIRIVAYSSIVGWVFLLLAVWADRNRSNRNAAVVERAT
jgi:LexA-binding, inner membrane-associated putative hydrolase